MLAWGAAARSGHPAARTPDRPHHHRPSGPPRRTRTRPHRGFALNEGESASGVRTIAVPVLDHTNRARFALALRSSPEAMASARLSWFVEQAAACATALEVLLLPPGQRRVGPRPTIALP
ncbi:IclR family transcriptional regulator C-terminal domain-containing protein [Catenulispora yoronensis]